MADQNGNLGHRYAIGVLATGIAPLINRITVGGWLIRFPVNDLPSDPAFEMYAGVIQGPGGQAIVYIDDTQADVILNGRRSAYNPQQPMYVRKGQEISFHWTVSNSSAAGSAPQAWIWLRIPEVGRL